ncbi:hypothetical protein FACS189421_14240 [Bacteroidia bacterium]|nr:hypothetical protein FACS189421_14240 [Bacteroidia bacterium]GHT43101.1 hypothetical protein FACS189437_10940 [Bacteroidia bacterium]GHT47946.1 hypothetical protein FACS189440_10190 [Bacteroidia bacterium]
MEEAEKKSRKRKPKAYLFKDGVRMELVVPKPERLSAYGLWLKEHPNGEGEILDMRAVMK